MYGDVKSISVTTIIVCPTVMLIGLKYYGPLCHRYSSIDEGEKV
jgi:hypothetical protein